jgi:hypothetical protein
MINPPNDQLKSNKNEDHTHETEPNTTDQCG